MSTEYGDISPRVAVHAQRQLLERGVASMVFEKFGQGKPVPMKSSLVTKFRRYSALPFATTPLTEGVTPSSKQMAAVDITATLVQYGDLLTISDIVQDTHEDPVMMEAMELLGEQASQTIETIRFDILKAGTNVHYANGATRAGINTAYTKARQRAIVRSLKSQNAKYISKSIKSTPSWGTEQVQPSFIGVIHPDMEGVIRDFEGFVPAEKYGTAKPYETELGKVEDVRYVCSTIIQPWADAGAAAGATLMSTSGTSADVYPVLVFGRDAYGIVPLKGRNSITPSVLNAGTPSKSDPLGQRGHASWKAMTTAAILNDNWMARAECAVTI